jgi:hypothetical protein
MAKAKPPFLARLTKHFRADPKDLPVLEQHFAIYDRANVHLAIGDLLAEDEKSASLTGVIIPHHYDGVTIAKLARPTSSKFYDFGPVEYVDEPLPGGQRLSCVKRGLYLFRMDKAPIALLISESEYRPNKGLIAEIMASSQEIAEKFSVRLTRLVRHGKAFRGHVLSLERDCYGNSIIKFHQLPAVSREHVILPAELLNRIERHTVAFSEHAARLTSAGRHLKRGILLHGPPGTGKTFSAMYLASRMPGRTTFLITGGGMGSIETACEMAKLLAPATVILEDVDLIGTQREHQVVGANALLFELLNQMDGLSDDTDILFILTTNRPDVLEPALASRPGRIDQAIEVPTPDEDCRRRLVQLYAKGLTLKVNSLDELVRKMDGVSAAFIRELLRKGAVIAAIDSPGEIVVRDEHLREAMEELVIAGGALTQSLLGGKKK